MKYLYYFGATCALLNAIFEFTGYANTNYIAVGILWLLLSFDFLRSGLNR
jgi:uncharacterized membrane protein